MVDVSVSYNKYKFIGNEFLTWLLFLIESNEDYLREINETITALEIDGCIVMEKTNDDVSKVISIKGKDLSLEEAMTALRMGAVVSEIRLLYSHDDQKWKFTLKGENLNFSSLKLPNVVAIGKTESIEGIFLDKVYLYERVVSLMDSLFSHFVKLRISNDWADKTVKLMKSWIRVK